MVIDSNNTELLFLNYYNKGYRSTGKIDRLESRRGEFQKKRWVTWNRPVRREGIYQLPIVFSVRRYGKFSVSELPF